jgi:hypothetical protein
VNVKFVKLLNDQGVTYPSYDVLWSLVRLSGFETIEQNEVNDDIDDVLVFPINSGNAHAMANRKRRFKAVLLQLERPAGAFADLVPAFWDEVLIADRWLALQTKLLHPCVKFMPIGGHPDLCIEPSADKQYDFAVFSYLWGKREHRVKQLQSQGYTVAPNAWGDERAALMSQCRRGLCLHQDNLSIIEPLRMTMFACAKLPLVCDPSADPYPYRTYHLMEIDQANDWETNWKAMTEGFTFRRCVEEAIA